MRLRPGEHSQCGCDGALGLWLRGLRCVSVLVVVVRVKGASRPCGLEQVRPLTRTTSTREGRSYADPAQRCELLPVVPPARLVRAGVFATCGGSVGLVVPRLRGGSPSRLTELRRTCRVTGFPCGVDGFCRSGWWAGS